MPELASNSSILMPLRRESREQANKYGMRKQIQYAYIIACWYSTATPLPTELRRLEEYRSIVLKYYRMCVSS